MPTRRRWSNDDDCFAFRLLRFHNLGGLRLLVLFLEMSINYQTVFNVRRYDVPHTRS